MKLVMVIPAYNESENLPNVIKSWGEVLLQCDPGGKILVVNDGSKDNTQELLEVMKMDFSFLEVFNKENSGHGPSCWVGYKKAIEMGADWVFQTDSDGQTDPNDFKKLWQVKDSYEALIGHRVSRGDGLVRTFIGFVLRCVLYITMKTWVRDANTPFRLIRSSALNDFLSFCPPDFFLTNALMSGYLKKQGRSVVWLPISFHERELGPQSVNLKNIVSIGVSATLSLFKIGRK